MPNSAEPAPANVPEAKKKQWEAVYKSAFSDAKKAGKTDKEAESQAFAEANGVIKKETKSATPGKLEVRLVNSGELRASADGEPLQITGYAALWDSPSEVMPEFFGPGFVEKIKPGAFSRALAAKQDVRALVNHDPSQIIGRSSNGTLRLSEDGKGLHYEIDLPDTQTGRDIHTLVKRGDISQSSFGFRVFSDGKKRGEEWFDPEEGPSQRTLTDLDLFDVSPVTFPAYPATSVSARSLWPDGVPEEIEARAAVMKKEEDGEHPASHYLAVEDPKEPSTWHLRVKGVDGKPDHTLMGAAWAALHEGYRGNKYEGPKKQEAIDKLKSLYKEEDMELPSEKNSLDASSEDLRGRMVLARLKGLQ